MRQEDLMSYIYIGVREQRARELIDQVATADHTLERSICEGCDTTDNNAQTFNNTGTEEGVLQMVIYMLSEVEVEIIMHRLLITLVLKKVVLQMVIYMLSEVEAKVKTTITTTEQNVKTVETSTKGMHVGLKIKNVIFVIK